MSPAARLRALGACDGAVSWAASHPRTRPERLWQTCQRGDWLLWIATRLGVDRRLLVLAACDCARTALVHVPAGEDRPRLAIEFAEAWTRGEATLAEVRAATARAWAAANSVRAWAAANSVYAGAAAAAYFTAAACAADADDDADDADDAAYFTAAACAARADASDADASDRARTASLARSADLVRARILWTVVEPLWGAP